MIKSPYLLAALLFFGSCSNESEELTAGPKKPMTVEVVELEPADVTRTISIPGTVVPGEEVTLYSEVSGLIESITFREGQLVQKGTVLMRVDTDVLRAQRNQQQVELDLARKDEARKKALLNGKGISLEEYEKSAAALATIEAQIALTNVQISKATIRAPFSGRVGLRRVSPGAFITPNTIITTIVQENPIKIEFAVSERYAGAVRPGQQIHFKTDRGTETFTATVYAYEPAVNTATRMLTVRAELNNTGGLIAGSFVSIDYDLGKETAAFMVPAESVIPVLKGQKILVVRAGKIVEVPVEIGIRTADKVQIIGAVSKGDKVLVSGLLAVKEGVPVETKIVKR